MSTSNLVETAARREPAGGTADPPPALAARLANRCRMSADPFDLARFVTAQQHNLSDALGEIRDGCKVSHWMWYVFPQFAGLGRSVTAQRYAIGSRAEAEAYLAHPLLGPRLNDCCEALLAVDGKSAGEIFGDLDAMKLRSCVTLFDNVSPGGVFSRVLAKYFDGEPDRRTLALVGRG